MIKIIHEGERRPSRDEYFIAMAQLVSLRGTCVRRKTGCVLVDKNGFVIGTGYNGRPSGAEHCSSGFFCEGYDQPSGQGLHLCEAIHAEANALLPCKNTQEIVTAYCTHSPCIHCVKLLQNTSCRNIVFANRYAHDSVSKELWEREPMIGRSWTHYDMERGCRA